MKKVIGLIMMTLLLSQTNSQAQMKDRSKVDDAYKWRLEDLYETDAVWAETKDKVAAQFDDVSKYKGQLTTSAKALFECLDLVNDIDKELSRLYGYASKKSDLDTRNSKNMGMKQEMSQIYTNFGSALSFIEPELVHLDKKQIDAFIKEEAGLEIYRHYLLDIQRRKAHKLSDKEEKILAEAGLMAGSPHSIFNIFNNAEMPFPTVTLSDGTEAYLDNAGYSRFRAVANRKDREKVFETFWEAYGKFSATYGAQLYGNVKKDMFYAKTRHYESSLHSALDANNIPVDVYHALVDGVNDNLDSFHRYLKIKKRMLGVDTLKYLDLYAPTVEGVDLAYNYKEGKKVIVDALKPLGKDYVKVIKKAFDDRWIDVYPSTGKRSGAYSSGGAYDVHPYILLNYNGKYNDVSTLAHELGHTMHSYLSNKNQPYAAADYSIFVAEVASTLNEALLMDKMKKEIKDDDIRLSLLMEYLDGLKGTVFRQTQFAEFELVIHETAEKGIPLTGDKLTELYADILKRYYGHEEDVCHIDDYVTVEWAYIPHFYYNFYVYQYATSFTASTALAEKVLNKEKGAVNKVLEFLSAGGSDYPINILKNAGVDMTTSEPFDKTMDAMNRTMDEIEKILDKKGI